VACPPTSLIGRATSLDGREMMEREGKVKGSIFRGMWLRVEV